MRKEHGYRRFLGICFGVHPHAIFLFVVGFAFLCCFLLCCFLVGCSKKEGDGLPKGQKLAVLNWPDYFGKTTLSDFENEFNAEVTYYEFSSNEELKKKLLTSTQNYDVIFPSDYMVRELIDDKFLATISVDKLSNFQHVDPRFKNLHFDPDNKHCVPYSWGTSGLGINVQKVKKDVTSWEILWDEEYINKISILNEPRGSFVPALKRLRYSLNTTDPDEIEQATALTSQFIPLVKAYTNDRYSDLLNTGDVWIAQGYSGDLYRLSKENLDIKFILPQEGSDLWVDNICIPKNAQHKGLALKFLDFLLRPEVSGGITNHTGFPTANLAARQFVKKEILANSMIFPPEDVLAKSEFVTGGEEVTELYEVAWAKAKRSRRSSETSIR